MPFVFWGDNFSTLSVLSSTEGLVPENRESRKNGQAEFAALTGVLRIFQKFSIISDAASTSLSTGASDAGVVLLAGSAGI